MGDGRQIKVMVNYSVRGKIVRPFRKFTSFVQKRIFSGKLSALFCRADNSLNIKCICNILQKKVLLMHVCCMQQNF